MKVTAIKDSDKYKWYEGTIDDKIGYLRGDLPSVNAGFFCSGGRFLRRRGSRTVYYGKARHPADFGS